MGIWNKQEEQATRLLEILEMQNSTLKQVCFTEGIQGFVDFSGVSESEILEMQNSSISASQ